jgi:hypothetical protein
MWGQARREWKKPLTHGTRMSVKEKKKRRKNKRDEEEGAGRNPVGSPITKKRPKRL